MKITSYKNLILSIVTCCAVLVPSLSQAWWNTDWAARNKISIDTTKNGADLAEGVGNVPVLVRLHTGNFSFLDAKEDGSDIRFVDGDDKTPLKFHVEKFDPINEIALIWVQAPKLSAAANSDAIWLYYANPKANAASDAKSTYDVNQTGVYHFSEKDGAAPDQTAYGNNATAFTAARDSASLIGGGLNFNGADKLVIPASPSLKFADGGLTLSAWIKIAAPQTNAVLFDIHDGAMALVVGLDQAQLYAKIIGKNAAVETPRHGAVTPGAWHHVAVTAGKRLAVYLDGDEVSGVEQALPALNGALTVGASAAGSNGYAGALDELEISNVARSAAWIKASARGQQPESKMTVYGADERNDSGGTSYFSTILHSVTMDGWVVIFVLAIMAAISWVVMVGKAMVVVRATADNTKFLASYKQLSADPGTLDRDDIKDESEEAESPFATALFGTHDHYQSSPIYRIYHIGIQEIKQRFGRTDPRAVGKILSPQSLGAIRASLDAAMVREQQKLNSQMVLLTIAISGGPFLGLLGTVVGVMITFAAIAASGDVNVNAIAPGIAAALVATVAGLAVAIPALFGYNYLISRIKAMTADMHVFVDEFVHKVAENYGVA